MNLVGLSDADNNDNTDEMKKWAKKTADWTRALTFTTVAPGDHIDCTDCGDVYFSL